MVRRQIQQRDGELAGPMQRSRIDEADGVHATIFRHMRMPGKQVIGLRRQQLPDVRVPMPVRDGDSFAAERCLATPFQADGAGALSCRSQVTNVVVVAEDEVERKDGTHFDDVGLREITAVNEGFGAGVAQ